MEAQRGQSKTRPERREREQNPGVRKVQAGFRELLGAGATGGKSYSER